MAAKPKAPAKPVPASAKTPGVPAPAEPAKSLIPNAPAPAQQLELHSSSAPFIFFDQASAFGYAGGIVRVTLEANTILALGREVANERVITAHLRMGLHAAQSLRAALDKALLMASPAETETKN